MRGAASPKWCVDERGCITSVMSWLAYYLNMNMLLLIGCFHSKVIPAKWCR